MDYFEHAASRRRKPAVSWEVVEVEPLIVGETDDEAEVERVREMWKRRIEQCS